MNDYTWLKDWCDANVNVTACDDEDGAHNLSEQAHAAAKTAKVSIEAALREAGFDNLQDYMMSVLNDRADCEIERLANQ